MTCVVRWWGVLFLKGMHFSSKMHVNLIFISENVVLAMNFVSRLALYWIVCIRLFSNWHILQSHHDFIERKCMIVCCAIGTFEVDSIKLEL